MRVAIKLNPLQLIVVYRSISNDLIRGKRQRFKCEYNSFDVYTVTFRIKKTRPWKFHERSHAFYIYMCVFCIFLALYNSEFGFKSVNSRDAPQYYFNIIYIRTSMYRPWMTSSWPEISRDQNCEHIKLRGSLRQESLLCSRCSWLRASGLPFFWIFNRLFNANDGDELALFCS